MCSVVLEGNMLRVRVVKSAIFLVTFAVYCCQLEQQNTAGYSKIYGPYCGYFVRSFSCGFSDGNLDFTDALSYPV